MPKIERLDYYVEPQVSIVPGSKNAGAITPVVVNASNGRDRVRHTIALGSFGTGAGFDAEVLESASSGERTRLFLAQVSRLRLPRRQTS